MSRAKRLLKSCEWAIASALLVDRGNVRWGKWRSVIPVGVFPWGEAHNLLLVCVCVCVCVCVFFPFILNIKFVGRTSRGHTGGRSHRISHPPSFCGACLTFFREKDSAIPFPRRQRSRLFLFTNELIVLHPLGILILPGSNSRPNVSVGYVVAPVAQRYLVTL